MSGWSLRHPEALAALVLVAWLWWRLRRVSPARSEWTGALAIWRRVPAASEARGARSREPSAMPWSLRAALCALCLGILALADPVTRPRGSAAPSWRLVVDRSPSMFLPRDTSSDAPTRIAVAVDLAVALCERHAVPAQAREWITPSGAGLASSRSELPPAEWLSQAWGTAAAPAWASMDVPGTLWLSDCAPPVAPLFAGVALSGATPIPGPIADLGEECWAFDGERLTRAAWASTRAGLLVGEGVLADTATLAGLWARSRGLPIVAEGQAAGLKLLRVEGSAPAGAGRLLREGWTATGTAAPLDADGGLREWAAFESSRGERFAAVAWRPGEVHLSIQRLDSGEVDPAAWALDWIELFESACLPEPSIVPLAQRLRSGPPLSAAPKTQPEHLARAGTQAEWLAGCAGVLALASVLLGRSAVRIGRQASQGAALGARPAVMG